MASIALCPGLKRSIHYCVSMRLVSASHVISGHDLKHGNPTGTNVESRQQTDDESNQWRHQLSDWTPQSLDHVTMTMMMIILY